MHNQPDGNRSDGLGFRHAAKYRFNSNRQIIVSPQNKTADASPQTMNQELGLLLRCNCASTQNPYIYTVIIESAQVNQYDLLGEKIFNRAVENLTGKAFRVIFSADGQIKDNSELISLLKIEAEKESLYKHGKTLMLEPDMLQDMMAMPYILLAPQVKMLSMKESPDFRQVALLEPTPWPVIKSPAPDHRVNYTVQGAYSENGCRKANITEDYELAGNSLLDMQAVYQTDYKMPGLLGFMRHFSFDSISGSGKKIYNMSTGWIERSVQNYTVTGTASYNLPINNTQPQIAIQQTITFERIE
jgi:hypothetical protein